MSYSIVQAASQIELGSAASGLVPVGDGSRGCRDTAHRALAFPQTRAGAVGAPPSGGPVNSLRQLRRERSDLSRWDPYDPEMLLLSLACERTRRAPAERLLIAVLEDAIRSYVRTAHVKTGRQRSLFATTRGWIASRDRTWLFSFENICDVLDLQSDRIRSRLRAWRLAHRV